jgi:protein-disulfide isomerase
MIAIGVVVVAVAVAGLWYLGGQSPAPGLDLGSSEIAQDADADTSLVQEMSMGNPDAPVTVIEYASYTCPHCQRFHAGPFKQLKAEYIDTGKINFIYREVYFDQFGLWAGMLARCGGGTERYFGITELLYQQQSQWLASRDPNGIAAALRRLGKTAGLGDDQITACLQDAAKAEALVAAYQANATADGIRSTPSFVINGTTYTNMSYAEFEEAMRNAGVDG